MSTKGIVSLLTVSLLFAASHSVGAMSGADKQPLSDKRLLAYCVTVYRGLQMRGPNGYESGGYESEKREYRAATKVFNLLPRQVFERRLVPLRKSLYRGTIAYTSVAYVLAFYDVDVVENCRRMLYAFDVPPTTPEAVRDAEIERYAPWCGDLFDAVNQVYKRHPSDRILAMVLKLQSDGEDWCDEQATLFFLNPSAVLRVSNRIGRIDLLATEILPRYAADYSRVHAGKAKGPDYSRIRAILDRMIQSSEREVARAARSCRVLFEKALKTP